MSSGNDGGREARNRFSRSIRTKLAGCRMGPTPREELAEGVSQRPGVGIALRPASANVTYIQAEP